VNILKKLKKSQVTRMTVIINDH